ncbi:AAA family ATPase [Flexivirga lutea]
MRLHRLRLQAFGPFAGTEWVDFDDLAAAGLHLIHGPTGAGKTSILDGICFALFGGVPGGRMQGRDTLRSDHADPGVRPEVELEFGVGDRRLRVRRSPEHQVPKKRGSGTRTQRGSVTLEERRNGAWQTVGTRHDEVAQTIGDLLGMGLPQFAQVMLLPQGEFTAFLRAKPDDRGRLLERLFDISDFAALEQWLTAHRKALEARAIEAQAHRGALLARAAEAITELEVTELEVTGTDEPATHDTAWDGSAAGLDRLTATLSEALTTALAAADTAAGDVDRWRGRLQAEQTLAGLQRQARAAQQAMDRVAAERPRVRAARDRLQLAERADRCAPAIVALTRRRAAHDAARQDADFRRHELVRRAAWSVPEPSAESALSESALVPLAERAEAGGAALAGHAELRRHQDDVAGQLEATRTAVEEATAEVDRRRAAVAAAGRQLEDLDARRAAVQAAATAHPHWDRLHREVDLACQALDAATSDVDAAIAAGDRHRQTQRRWAAAEREVLRLRTARVDGIAAELAADLGHGDPCPVCGSADHPRLARRADGHVDAEQVAAAEHAAGTALTAAERAGSAWSTTVGRAHSSSRAALEAIGILAATDAEPLDEVGADRQRVLQLRTELRAATESAHARAAAALDGFGDAAMATDEAKVASEALSAALVELAGSLTPGRHEIADRAAAAQSAVRQLQVVDDQLAAFDAEWHAARDAVRTAEEAVQLASARVEALQEQRAALDTRTRQMGREHDDVCGCAPGAQDLDATTDPVATHRECVALLDRLVAAAAAQRAAAAELATARQELDAVLEHTGFADQAAAAAARLDEHDVRQVQAMLERARSDEERATGVLEQPEVAAAVAAPPADCETVAAELAVAERTARHTRDAVAEVRRALTTLQRIGAELAAHDAEHATLQEELSVATSVATAVTGSGDNTMRMRLTAYVLAARLESVTALANERLQAMTGGRYQLEHTDERAAHGSKSGLGLRVRDAWTGTTRDTATLSGGESFIASLALALGLGDAVLEAAGGRRLETLLVDEGFGSLDEDSLEQVLDVLDGLRAGGRTVGIVSHVAELRTRIPAQIRVRKTAHGSTLQVHTDAVA